MTQFQNNTIRFVGKSENPAAIEILQHLLAHHDTGFRKLAFGLLYLKKSPEIYTYLFEKFLSDEEYWSNPDVVAPERLAKIADSALREASGKYRKEASAIAVKYRLYEVLPSVVLFCEAQDKQLSAYMRKVLLDLAEVFYDEIMNAPPEERCNFDRKRDWFVSQLDSPIKRFSISGIDEAIQSLLIITKKDFDLMKLLTADHRSAAAQKMREFLQHGNHRSFLRVLLNYVDDPDSPGIMDDIISQRSDALFVRKLLEYVGKDPSAEFRLTLKRFTDIAWFKADNPELPELVDGLETQAVQLLMSSGFPKERIIPLYKFFLRLNLFRYFEKICKS